MSHVMLLWQPSECVYLINDYVMLFSENKYDDDDDDTALASIWTISIRRIDWQHNSSGKRGMNTDANLTCEFILLAGLELPGVGVEPPVHDYRRSFLSE